MGGLYNLQTIIHLSFLSNILSYFISSSDIKYIIIIMSFHYTKQINLFKGKCL